MNNFLVFWLALSVSGSLAALLLMALKPCLRRFSKSWQYYIWLLVLLRLLLPFSPGVSAAEAAGQRGGMDTAGQAALAERFFKTEETAPQASPSTAGVQGPETEMHTGAAADFFENHIWGVLWAAAAAALLLQKIYAYRRLVKTVKKESKPVPKGTVTGILEKVCREMRLRKPITVCINPFVRAPMLLDGRQAMIVLPEKQTPAEELEYILRHELTHCRRMDFLYKWLVEITVCLHWFNPLVYWMRRQISKACELSCDEAVASRLNGRERRRYGDTLLNALEADRRGGKNMMAAFLNEDGSLMQERLQAISQYRKKSKTMAFAAAAATVVLLGAAVLAGVYPLTAAQAAGRVQDAEAPCYRLQPGEELPLGMRQLTADTACEARLTWAGGGRLTLLCTSPQNQEKRYPLESGGVVRFETEEDGLYRITIKNEGTAAAENINGAVSTGLHTLRTDGGYLNGQDTQTVVYDAVELRRYEGEDGHFYIHSIMANHTAQKITGYQRGMLAFDKDGNPLKIDWYSLDMQQENAWFYLYEDETADIAAGATEDVFGGWSLNLWGTDLAAEKIAYVLYCDKEITFENGTVWRNPGFDEWRDTYEGEKIDPAQLKSYYPYCQQIKTEE